MKSCLLTEASPLTIYNLDILFKEIKLSTTVQIKKTLLADVQALKLSNEKLNSWQAQLLSFQHLVDYLVLNEVLWVEGRQHPVGVFFFAKLEQIRQNFGVNEIQSLRYLLKN